MQAFHERSIGDLAQFALEATSDAVYCLDVEWRFTYANANATRLLQRERGELLGAVVWDVFPEALDSEVGVAFRRARKDRESVELDGFYFAPLETWFEVRAFPDDQGLVVFFRDVSARREHDVERARLVDRYWYRARHDDLTGLPNRLLLAEHLAKLEPGEAVGLLFVDIDGFKGVNDSLGHHVGDRLLRDLAARLQLATGPCDLLTRHSGDEFVVVVHGCDEAEAAERADRIQGSLAEAFDVAGNQLPLSASVGIAVGRPDRVDPSDLIDDADTAMYAAKRAGKARSHLFTPELRVQARERLDVVGGLAGALRDGELELHYQPIQRLHTGRFEEVEALMRWRHPERGLLSPAAFLAIAEETGAIVAMGRWALVTAAGQARAWQQAGRPLATSVNISAQHFATGTLVADVAHALDVAGLPADLLVLELTETAVDGNFEQAVQQLRDIRALGVRVAIDDFGSGYSSLERLATFPVDSLKFDASLIQGSDGSGVGEILQGIVSAVVAVADALGVPTLAEGIETEAHWRTAREMGCAWGQGYLMARPMPAADVAGFVARHDREAWVPPG